jgi:aerobic carbon-monoxide dehydrogenase small subunit
MKKIEITLTVNGKERKVSVDSGARLLDVIREDLHLSGTKEGCGIGECGACTVIMNGKTVTSCLVPAAQADGTDILTVEGLEARQNELHPLQEAFIEAGAVQCGFCTPGMILSAYSLLQSVKNPSVAQIKTALSGNLCRCTGYKQIIEAVQLASKKMNKGGK